MIYANKGLMTVVDYKNKIIELKQLKKEIVAELAEILKKDYGIE